MRWPIVLLIFILGIGAAIAGFRFFQNAQQQRYTESVHAIAAEVGNTSQSQLAAFEKCWDLRSHCGLMVYFTTKHTRETLGNQVAQLRLEEVLTRDVDGRSLFTDLNMSSTHVLTVNGQGGASQPVPSELTPAGYEWWLTTLDGHNLFVALFTINQAHQYAFDGQPIEGNIIGVMLQTR
ncbi:MAG: hypothetical protein M3R61_09755 [Chloroflexota bacterium]|nr:hypothetical protein [Chloroflexota bacterium]